MAGKITKTSEQYLAEVNAVQNNEFELCGTDYSGAKHSMSLRHIPCGNIITKRADTFMRACCDYCRKNNPEKLAIAMEKRKATCIKRFGTETYMESDEGKQRFQETIKEMGGKQVFINKIKATNKEKYGHEWATQNDEVKLKISEFSLSKYSEFQKLFHNKDTLKEGILQLTEQLQRKPTLTEILEASGYAALTSLYNHHELGRHYNLYEVTEAGRSKQEKEIEEFIRNNYNGEILTNQKILRKEGKHSLEIDIYLPELKTGIEYHGVVVHDTSINQPYYSPKSKTYHAEKLALAKNQGIRLIQIFSDEWLTKQEIVKAKILRILKLFKGETIGARKCTIKEIESKVKNEFLNKNHIQGADRATIKLGLFYEDRLVSVITFIKSYRVKGRVESPWELSRFASDINLNVIGAFSKLLKYALGNYEIKELETFADLRWSSELDNVYEKNGFKKVRATELNYFYGKNDYERSHRFNFRKASLKDKFPDIYQEELTEQKIMELAGYHRVYDCGNLKFSYLFQ